MFQIVACRCRVALDAFDIASELCWIRKTGTVIIEIGRNALTHLARHFQRLVVPAPIFNHKMFNEELQCPAKLDFICSGR